jgi:oxygen-independent coproporphyrinogen III oxidase
MGYTTTQSKLIIGLGVSSISDAWSAFAQNDKEVESYQEKINQGVLPLVHGHALNSEDLVIRKKILELMCKNSTMLDAELFEDAFIESAIDKLKKLEEDGLVTMSEEQILVTNKGKSFIRNISAAIDAHLWRKQITGNTFSKAI